MTTEREIQSAAELIFRWLQQLPTPRDAAAALALAQTALIWTQQPKDEAAVRKIMADTVDAVVLMWQAQLAEKMKCETVN